MSIQRKSAQFTDFYYQHSLRVFLLFHIYIHIYINIYIYI